MGLTGDFAKLERFITGIGRCPKVIMAEATKVARSGVQDQYQKGFEASRDPWGETWPQRRGATTSVGKPLQGPTGALQGAEPFASTNTVRLRPPRYWVYHQIGANNMERRAVLPFAASDWDDPIQELIVDAVENYFESI